MSYNVKVNKKRVDRFKLAPVDELKASIDEQPDIKTRLSEDFKGTLKSEGIVIDDTFKQKIHEQWRSMIQADIREVMDKQPDDKKPLYTMVREGKPLKLKVKIDKTTGKKSVTTRRNS